MNSFNLVLCDVNRANLLPFAFVRPVADMRVGILTIREKWEMISGEKTCSLTENYLQKKYPLKKADVNYLIDASVLPSADLWNEIKKLEPKEQLLSGNKLIAACVNDSDFNFSKLPEKFDGYKSVSFSDSISEIKNCCDIFTLNDKAIRTDFELITRGRKSQPLSKTNQFIGEANIFIEEGAVVECSILNAGTGPIYIGKDAEVMEGCMIRGPFALGKHATLKMGTKIYGATTVGPHSKVGGEVSNSVIFGYSNKAHDGFLGNSVIGEWCNLGADTNNSNLKNNYSNVKLYNYAKQDYVDTGLQFCGLMMGDHSKCGINTMFNTGTVVGVSSNIFGSGFPPKYIPSFSWGGFENPETFELSKAIELAKQVYKRRNIEFTIEEEEILKYIFKIK